MKNAICCSHIGKRPNHEDNYVLNGKFLSMAQQKQMKEDQKPLCITSETEEKICYYAVSDGMGGQNAGEVASGICAERLAALKKQVEKCGSLEEMVHLFQAAVAQINRIVCKTGFGNEKLKGMGATMVLFAVYENACAVLNIGDSRAYFFDGNNLTRLTRDNTEGQRILDLGLLTPEEIVNFPARKNLNRYIGYGQSGFILQADVYYPNIEQGTVLLCSDGITDALSDEEIKNILSSEKELPEAGKKLVEQAASDLNADNSTVILVQIG